MAGRPAILGGPAGRALLAGLLLLAWPGAAAADPLAVLERMEAAYARVSGYIARFVRQERVGGVLRPREEALLKYQRPGRVYLRWLTGPATGREIIYVPGRDDDRALVREPGVLTRFFTVMLPPDSPRVLRESRHPLTDVGIWRLIELILTETRHAARAGALRITRTGSDGAEERWELAAVGEETRGCACRRLELAVSVRTGLPVRASTYDGRDRLVAHYAYEDVRLDPGLTGADFDPRNPEYGFPGMRVSVE